MIKNTVFRFLFLPRVRYVYMLGSHCQSDQLDRPDRPNSPKLDQTRSSSTNCLIGVVGLQGVPPHDPHTTIQNSTTSTRQQSRSLYDRPDLYQISRSTRSTRPIPDDFPIASWAFDYIFIMKIVQEVQETKKSAKRCKVLVCAQANNELFNVTESKVI